MYIKVDLKIFAFMAILFITRQIEVYTVLMFFAILHELAHLVCGWVLGFKTEQITIMPYGLNLRFRVNYNDYNLKLKKGTMISLKRIIIAIAGPLLNIVIAIVLLIIGITSKCILISRFQELIYCNLVIALFNLLPIYPMDGGKIIQELLHIYCGLRKSYKIIQIITWISISILTAISSVLILYYENMAILFIIFYLWIIALKTKKQLDMKEKIYKKIYYVNKNTCNS